MEFYNREASQEFAKLCQTLENAKMIEVCSTILPQLAIPRIRNHPAYPAYREQANAQIGERSEWMREILGKIEAPGTIEGGDVAWLDKHTLAVGHTYRTNEDGIKQLKGLLEPKGVSVIIVDLPHYKGKQDVFHLMSILSPVDKNLAVVYSPLMPIKFRNELLRRGFELIEVPEEEFESMGCNVLAIGPRHCIMVDDIVDTAGTLCQAAEILKEKGAKKVVAYATHAVLSGGAIENISNSKLDELVITNTIPLNDNASKCSKVRQLSIAKTLADVIRRISDEQSISTIFAESS